MQSCFFFEQSSWRPQLLYCRILLLEADQLATINSTVPLYCRHPQRSSCYLTKLVCGHRRIHYHRHVMFLRASCSFHVPNVFPTMASLMALGMHNSFTISVRRPQVDHCHLSQQ
ncbi:hypothetical protein PoB_005543700 [Plakobranchus ocellatus]|uniref:Uncharacterized protein n=1 Tax=Plakobranchus ocellatus TaxID=259542 RepID=A0AAV4CBK9_9GAST|nr:hypothetical protein PoB_005543700 [Plakobranchus ocellatus]